MRGIRRYIRINMESIHPFSLAGKVAVVTGTSRGNGRGIAEALLNAGAEVYCAQRNLEGGIAHANAHLVSTDVTQKRDLEKLVARVVQEQKKIDILVNNAGISQGNPSEEYTEEDWDQSYETNLKAVFLLSQIAAREMIKRKSGVIINITSINAEVGFPNNPAYVAFKGGVKQLTKAFAVDWGKYNIRVNNLGLGYFPTDMTKKSWDDLELRQERANHTLLGRWGGAEDLAGPAVFLASDASSYMTGQDLYIDGGWLAKGL